MPEITPPAVDLAAIRARLDALPESWVMGHEPPGLIQGDDLSFIAHAPSDIRALVAEVEALRAANEQLEKLAYQDYNDSDYPKGNDHD